MAYTPKLSPLSPFEGRLKGGNMKKVWDIELRRSYDLESSGSRNYTVIADNAKEAIDKAIHAHKRQARKNFDHIDYRCAVKVELLCTID